MCYVNYTTESKYKSLHHNNYTDDMKRDTTNEKGNCHGCIFIGDNDHVSHEHLCAESMSEVAEVKANGYCDKCKPIWKWYNKVNPIKRYLLEKTGFVFRTGR